MQLSFARARRWNPLTLTLLALLVVFNLAQCFSLVHRVHGDGTDFTVFYNTGKLLDGGAGGELYRGKDETTAWLRTIPPFGQMVFAPFGQSSLQAAAISWSVFNLALLAATAWTLGFIGREMKRKRRVFSAVWPHLVLLMLLMAPGSIQVGQFSVLFVACWVFWLGASAGRWPWLAGAALAIPAAIKIYPALLFALPLIARKPRVLAATLLFVSLWCTAPFLLYGARTLELSRSFWQNAIASDGGRVAESQRSASTANQGIDSIALRYLTSGQPMQRKYPNLPHLDLPGAQVLRALNFVRAAMILVTLLVGFAFWKRICQSPRSQLWGQAMLLALLCAMLYVVLPGAKSRYAIYAFPALWPLVCCAFVARRLNQKAAFWAWSVAAVVCALLLVQAMPKGMRLYGFGWGGAFVVWSLNLALLWRWSRNRGRGILAGKSLDLRAL